MVFQIFVGFSPEKSRLQICPLHIFGNKPPQMVPTDLKGGVVIPLIFPKVP